MSTSRHLTGLRRFAKAAVAVCASLGLVLAAGGCGASSGESKTIYFWNNLVGDDGPAMQRIVKEYNAQSDYKVVFQPMNGGDLTTKIYSVMQTGKNIPDIIIGDQFQTAVLQSQGLLDTMDDWQKVAPDLKESSFLPATWKGVTINGKAYGIPLYLYQMAIYYNKDLVKKYNLQYILDDGFVTIDEIKDLKGKLPKGTYALTYGNLPWAFMSLLYGAGGTLRERYGRPDQGRVAQAHGEAQGSVRRRCGRPDGRRRRAGVRFRQGRVRAAWHVGAGQYVQHLGRRQDRGSQHPAVQRRQSGELLLPVQLDAVEGSAPLRGEIRSRRRLRQVRVRALDGLV